jgi:hypothetical protein
MWTDASIGKTSTNGGVIDVPVRSWGIFVGVFGKRKHIIFAQNSFRYAEGLLDLDYNHLFLKSYDNKVYCPPSHKTIRYQA